MKKEKISYSRLRSFKNCKRYFYYDYIRKLEAKEKPIYYSEGIAMHKALEKWYKHQDLNRGIDAITRYYAENKPDTGDMGDVQRWIISGEMIQKIFARYVDQYQDEKFEVINTEIEFDIDFEKFRLRGFVDLLVKENGLYWLVEHKTARTIDEKYMMRLTMDYQSICYIYAIEKIMNIKIQGVIYNMILKQLPKKPKILKSGQLSTDKSRNVELIDVLKAISKHKLDPDDYSHYLDYLRNIKKKYFFRERLVFPRESVREFEKEMIQTVDDIIHTKENEYWYKNTSNCVTFGVCNFYDICTACDPESIIDVSFKQKEFKEK